MNTIGIDADVVDNKVQDLERKLTFHEGEGRMVG